MMERELGVTIIMMVCFFITYLFMLFGRNK